MKVYRYGLHMRGGDCQIVISEKDTEEFVEYLMSSKWVALKLSKPSKWENYGDKDANFRVIMLSWENIDTISIDEEEEYTLDE